MDDNSVGSSVKSSPDATGASPPVPPGDNTPVTVGRYQIEARLGVGGMGAVYKAHDPTLRRTVAVKIPHLSDTTNRQTAIQRFLREAHTAARVQHANVCPIFDLGEADGVPFLVMPLVSGPTLKDALDTRRNRAGDDKAVWLCVQIAEGLAAIHSHQLIHRDLKPGNILLQRSQAGSVAKVVPLITDFGLSRPERAGDQITAEGNLVGTPSYMSPEQAAGFNSAVDARSDVYSLGVILYQVLSGELPFTGPIGHVLAQIQSQDVPPVTRYRPDLTPAQVAVVHKALARNPADRYQTAGEFADALRQWVTQLPGSATAPPASSPATNQTTVTIPPSAPPNQPTVTVVPLTPAKPAAPDPPAPPVPARPARPARRRQPVVVGPPHPGPHGPSRRAILISLLSSLPVLGSLAYLMLPWLRQMFPGTAGYSPSAFPTYQPPRTDLPPTRITLRGGGSPTAEPIMQAWEKTYTVGVGRPNTPFERADLRAAVEKVFSGQFAFACTEVPVTEEQAKAAGRKLTDVVHIPLAVEALVPVFNIPDTFVLNFSPAVLAGIYSGTIRKWDDPAIRESNPRVKLPAEEIAVLCRNDSSSTTFVWQDYLCAVAPTVFPKCLKRGAASTEWEWVGERPNVAPVGWHDGSPGWVNVPKYAVGYAPYGLAIRHNLTVGQVEAEGGSPITVKPQTVAAAVANKLLGGISPDLRMSLVGTPGKDSYPICAFLWAVVLASQTDEQGKELVRFLRWAINQGQGVVQNAHFFPLPADIVKRIDAKLDEISR